MIVPDAMLTDPKAVAALCDALRRRDTLLSSAYFWVWKVLPQAAKEKRPVPVPAYVLRRNSAFILRHMGVVARPAVPSLIQALRADEKEEIRNLAALALGTIAREDPVPAVVAALTQALNDKSVLVRSSAAWNLRRVIPEVPNQWE
jgi:hypothetical protein